MDGNIILLVGVLIILYFVFKPGSNRVTKGTEQIDKESNPYHGFTPEWQEILKKKEVELRRKLGQDPLWSLQQETKMLEWKLRMKETYSNFAPEGAFCIGMLREDMLESATFEGWSTDKKFGVIENKDCEIYTFFTDDYKPLDRAFH